MQSISICTYSKNRIEHAKGFFSALLPILNPIDEVIYVDYNDPQNSKDYVKGLNNPQIKVYEVPGVKYWHMNHARNCAGIQATKDILFFVDIDIFITNELLEFIRNNNESNQFISSRMCASAVSTGSCAVKKEMYYTVNGYEEMFTGYGHDDAQFGDMLCKNNYKELNFPISNSRNDIVGTSWCEEKSKENYEFNTSLRSLILKSPLIKNNFQRTIGYGSKLY